MAKRKKKKASAQPTNKTVTAAEKVKALSDVFLAVKRKRFEIDQSPVVLTSKERQQLSADYDAARDAYYKGLSEFVDASDPSVGQLIQQIDAQRAALKSLLVSQNQAVQILDAISGLVGLAGKLLALGTP